MSIALHKMVTYCINMHDGYKESDTADGRHFETRSQHRFATKLDS